MHILSPRACTKSFFRARAANKELSVAICLRLSCRETARISVLAGQSLPSRNHLHIVQRLHATGFSPASVLPAHAGSARCPRPGNHVRKALCQNALRFLASEYVAHTDDGQLRPFLDPGGGIDLAVVTKTGRADTAACQRRHRAGQPLPSRRRQPFAQAPQGPRCQSGQQGQNPCRTGHGFPAEALSQGEDGPKAPLYSHPLLCLSR